MVNPMAEDTKLNEDTKILEEIGDYKYGFHDRDDNYVFKSERGLNRAGCGKYFAHERRAAMDARISLEGAGALSCAPHADLGT